MTEGKKDILKTEIRLNEKTDQENALAFTHYGERPHITFGHGLKIEDVYCLSLLVLNGIQFNKRELATTYNLAHGNHIKPTQFIQTTFDTTKVPNIIRQDEKVRYKNVKS